MDSTLQNYIIGHVCPDGLWLRMPLCSCTLFWELPFPSVLYVFDEVLSVILQQLG
jgi:hypothetical protein